MAHKTFLQSLRETPIGNLPGKTFRPTEAEKLVLLNVDDLTQQGRSITQQDALNVPQEELEQHELSKDQLEAAFKQLCDVKLLELNPDDTVSISPQGQPVVDDLRQAEQESAQNEEPNNPDGLGPPGGGMNPMDNIGAPGGPTGGTALSGETLESLELIRYCNELSKLI